MRIRPDCLACVFRQCLEATKLSNSDENKAFSALKAAANLIPSFNNSDTPMSITMAMHRMVRERLGIDDPYKEVKRSFNEKGARAYPLLVQLMRSSHEPLETAIKIAIAGNIVDYALPIEKDLDKSLRLALESPLPMRDWEIFRKELEKSKNILYLLDNAGEIFYDKILIEHLVERGYEVAAVVRGGPAINDALLEDARFAGIDKLARVLTTGLDTVGFILNQASKEFLRALDQADLIIAKGQANLESLDETDYPAFFLLKAKCPIIAELTGVEVGGIVFQANRRRWRR
ncbi:DUF89 family protein [bacterium]|nr:DUF89 family protein [bacterium]